MNNEIIEKYLYYWDWEKLKSNFNTLVDEDNYIEFLEYLFEFADLDEIFKFLSSYSFANLGECYKKNKKLQ
ncbi:deoxyhypusine synthase family protein, partial [Campylobacter lari]|nr:deoxyhypusine synthase family protein [Campylobacter lari]